MEYYDSDDSLSDVQSGTTTNVLLGYAAREPTDDPISQLGGQPSWLSSSSLPPASLATCKVCNSNMSLLLQLNGDLPKRYPGHERRLHILSCRRTPCKRKEGSIRAFRSTRVMRQRAAEDAESSSVESAGKKEHKKDIGAELFGLTGPAIDTMRVNPFSMSSNIDEAQNPFSAAPTSLSSLAAKPPQRPARDPMTTLPETFAQKARISQQPPPSQSDATSEPWPSISSFPSPYPTYQLDADYEYLAPDNSSTKPSTSANHAAFLDSDTAPSTATQDEKDTFESPHDTAFQHFADRLAQNPEQVLRYDFDGAPLLYSKADAVGAIFAARPTTSVGGGGAKADASAPVKPTPGAGPRIPGCARCGARRVFELQLTPYAITVLEEEMEAAVALREGMEWGTVVLAVCEADCAGGTADGEVFYAEEWVGVQWEEVVKRGQAALNGKS